MHKIYLFFVVFDMTLTDQEFARLQKLACIKLSAEEQIKLGKQLQDIVVFLDKLPQVSGTKNTRHDNVLRTLKWVKTFDDAKALLQNVKHQKINNSIVIKSVLS